MADEAFFADVDAEAKKEATRLRERVLDMPDPKPLKLFDHAYAGGSPLLDAQRDSFAGYLASFEGSHH
jgi:pyruvate dehydrogenase E1 component alpha subunit